MISISALSPFSVIGMAGIGDRHGPESVIGFTGIRILLKSFQKLGYLPKLSQVPRQIQEHIAQAMALPPQNELGDVPRTTRSRYRQAIYGYLNVKPYREGGAEVIEKIVRQMAQTMSDPADLINVAIEQLVVDHFELPGYSTLDEFVNHWRHQAHRELCAQVTADSTEEQRAVLDGLLNREDGATRHMFTRLKELPAKASLKWVHQWEKHLATIEKIMNPQPFIAVLSTSKVEQFASEAYRMEISDIKGVATPEKRYTLLLCLLHQMQVRSRDQLVTMYLKRLGRLHHNAKQRLHDLRDKYRDMSEKMVDVFDAVVQQTAETDKLSAEEKDGTLGKQVRQIIGANGGAEKLKQECELLQAYHDNNYLPLLPHFYRRHRPMPFRLTQQLRVRSATQSQTLIQALAFIQEHQQKGGTHLPSDISLSFAGSRWQGLIREKVNGEVMFNKQLLEICVFSCLADGLRNGDLYVEGAETYADYRRQLLPWEECQSVLAEYCQTVGLPASATDFVKNLRQRFHDLAKRVDMAQTEDSDLYFDANGRPHLRQLAKQPTPEKAKELEAIMKSRMPEHHLLDILSNVHYWVRFTRHFGPPSGTDPKLSDPLSLYLLTIFGHGCLLGAAQTARHAHGLVTERIISIIATSG